MFYTVSWLIFGDPIFSALNSMVFFGSSSQSRFLRFLKRDVISELCVFSPLLLSLFVSGRSRRRMGPLKLNGGERAKPFWQMSIISSLAIAIATCRVSSIRLRQSLGKTWRGTSEGQHVLPGALLFRMLRIVSRRCIRALSFSPPSIVVVVSEVATTASSVFDAINTTYERLTLF